MLSSPNPGCDQWKPVGHFPTKPDPVALGWGPCLPTLQAVYLVVVALDQQLTVKCLHAVQALLALGKSAHVTATRWTKWSTALGMPDIKLEKASPTHPAVLLPPVDSSCTELVMDKPSGGFI